MSSNETAAYKIMRSLDVDYVLVIFGGVIGYSGDDINKFLWMVRIAEGEHPKDIRVCFVFLQLETNTKLLLQACNIYFCGFFHRNLIISLQMVSSALMQLVHRSYLIV